MTKIIRLTGSVSPKWLNRLLTRVMATLRKSNFEHGAEVGLTAAVDADMPGVRISSLRHSSAGFGLKDEYLLEDS